MKVRTIGCVAAELLEESHFAMVQGQSRHGVFLRLDPGWVIFLTCEAERGPLTVNIVGESGYLEDLVVGAQLAVSTAGSYPGQPVFTNPVSGTAGNLSSARDLLIDQKIPALDGNVESNLLLEIDQAQVWKASPHPPDTLPAGERKWAVAATIKQALKIRPAASLAALQAVHDGSVHGPEGEAGLFFPYLSKIIAQLASRQGSAGESLRSPLRQLDTHCFLALLGLGRGLTPTGDDILLGLLLALNRWRPLLAHGLDIGWLNRSILAQAYQRTTTISANLIECAARGQADERLVAALDGIMTGSPGPDETARLLSTWGSASGFDALCGMALGIS